MNDMDAVYKRVADRMTRSSFEARVKTIIDEFGGLIDKDAAALIVLDDEGSGEDIRLKVKDLKHGMTASFKARVKKVGEVRCFTKRSGCGGEVVNIETADETGCINLVLWDEQTSLVKSGRITKQKIINVINGSVKEGKYGLEVNLGGDSSISIE